MRHREIFAPKYLRDIGKHFALDRDVPNLAAIRQHVADWQTSWHNGTILRQSEIQLQKEFLHTFFAGCLGYRSKIGRNDWELDAEFTTAVDGTRADGYLGFFTPETQRTVAVIELKDAATDLDRPQNRKNDKRTPVEQAFSYVPKLGPDCRWVIVSNFRDIRLYHAQDQGRYEAFDITRLHEDEQLWRFLFLLHRDRLLPHGADSYLEHYHRQRLEQEQTVSEDFYRKFKQLRLSLFDHLKRNNPGHDELLLFEKTQKLLDRVVFVLFCEDKGLLPYDILRRVRQAAHASLDPTGGQNIWAQLKGLFRSIDKGNPAQNINRYNGGLFAPDPELDELQLADNMAELLLGLSQYDFDSDLNVNILGHIFEQSISDIEEIKADIAGHSTEKKTGKRKKDGIFYTPEYITRYIVREAVGGWLDERKRELGFDSLPELSDADLASVKMLQSGPRKGRVEGNAAVEQHRAAWTAYRQALSDIKVLDPACGSGAFLIQVFDFLSAEAQSVNDDIARLSLGLRSTDDLSRNILTNNIFGVDINRESVEITKLSLWLKTADNQSELTALDNNIRCGNSLIDDPEVAGELAFHWPTEFAEVFRKKGGFDVVVGNPPYVTFALGAKQKFEDDLTDYYKTQYPRSSSYKVSSYLIFFERSLSLLNPAGLLSFILPSTYQTNYFFKDFREYLISNHGIKSLTLLKYKVFQDAEMGFTSIPVVRGTKKEGDLTILKDSDSESNVLDMREYSVEQQKFLTLPDSKFLVSQELLGIWESAQLGSTQLGNKKQFVFYNGTKTGDNDKFLSDTPASPLYKPVLRGKDFYKYVVWGQEKYILFDKEKLWSNTNESMFTVPEKLLIRRTSDHLVIAYDNLQVYVLDTVHILYCKTEDFNLKYLLALLNSSLFNALYNLIVPEIGKAFAEVKIVNLEKLPIKNIPPADQSPFISLADRMLALHKTLHEHKRRFLQLVQAELGVATLSRALEHWEVLDFKGFSAELARQKVTLSLAQKSEWLEHFEQERVRVQALHDEIRATDHRIDELVFDLYGLTAEERAVVRGAG